MPPLARRAGNAIVPCVRARLAIVVVSLSGLAALTALLAPAACGQAPPSAPDAATTRPAVPWCQRRAESQALALLEDRMLSLPMIEGHTVRDWIADRALVELALWRAVHARRQVELTPRPGDRICRVTTSVGVADAAREWARLLLADSLVSVTELETIRQWSLRAGSGRLSGVGLGDSGARPPATPPPPGWEHLPAEAVTLAVRGARVDAAALVLTQARRLRLGASQSLGDVLDLFPLFEDAVRVRLGEHLSGEPVFEPFAVCRFPAVVARGDLIEVLTLAAADARRSSELPHIDFGRLTDPTWRGPISVEGFGTPPPVHLAWPDGSPHLETPTWADELLTATGEARVARPGAEADAVAAARIDAIRVMWSQVDELVLPDGRRVGPLIAAHPELADALASLEPRMQDAVPPVVRNGTAAVKITLPLALLWEALSETAGRPAPPASSRTTTAPASRPAN